MYTVYVYSIMQFIYIPEYKVITQNLSVAPYTMIMMIALCSVPRPHNGVSLLEHSCINRDSLPLIHIYAVLVQQRIQYLCHFRLGC